MALIIDTHLIVKELIDAGASEKQAEILVKRFVARDEVESLNSQLATKSDILKLESEIKLTNSSISWLKIIAIANLGALVSGIIGILFK